jgi:hypothetical protein
MDWNMTMHPEGQYVEIDTTGVADNESTLRMAKALTMALSDLKVQKILIDHSNIESVTGEAPDIYNRPKQLKEMGAIYGIKIAEVIKPEHREHFRFLEVVCMNRGFKFSIFSDRSSALEWLLT